MRAVRTVLAAPLIAGAVVIALPGVASASNVSINDGQGNGYLLTGTYTDATNTITIGGGDGINAFRTLVRPRTGVSGGRAEVILPNGASFTRSKRLPGLPEDRAYVLFIQRETGVNQWKTLNSTTFYT